MERDFSLHIYQSHADPPDGNEEQAIPGTSQRHESFLGGGHVKIVLRTMLRTVLSKYSVHRVLFKDLQ